MDSVFKKKYLDLSTLRNWKKNKKLNLKQAEEKNDKD